MLKLTDNDFERLVDFMKKNYGINLERKRVLIEGRLAHMISARGFKSFKDFIDFALADRTGNETMQLVNKLTTNHTFFMREPEHFEFLKKTVLPYLEKQNAASKTLELWCAASSTGQEPYTIVMTIDDYFGANASKWKVNLLATDLDTDVLAKAKAGVYTSDMLKDVPKDWLNKYFTKVDATTYRVIDRLRNQISFKQFNLMNNITERKLYDLISCRNVMIYFEQDTKNALVERFYDVTKDGGFLFTGHAESVGRDTRYTYIQPAVYRKVSHKPDAVGAAAKSETAGGGLAASKPAGSGLTASKPAASGFTASKPAGSGLTASKPAGSGFTASKPAASGFTATKPAASGLTANKTAGSGFTASKPAGSGFTATKPAGSGLTANKTAASRPTASRTAGSGLTAGKPTGSGFTANKPTGSGLAASKTAGSKLPPKR